jgi:hypothetical protein
MHLRALLKQSAEEAVEIVLCTKAAETPHCSTQSVRLASHTPGVELEVKGSSALLAPNKQLFYQRLTVLVQFSCFASLQARKFSFRHTNVIQNN